MLTRGGDLVLRRVKVLGWADVVTIKKRRARGMFPEQAETLRDAAFPVAA